MKRPVRPVGDPASRYRAGLTAASCRNVRRIVVDVNGADGGCCEAESCCDVNNLERASSLGAALDLNYVEMCELD